MMIAACTAEHMTSSNFQVHSRVYSQSQLYWNFGKSGSHFRQLEVELALNKEWSN